MNVLVAMSGGVDSSVAAALLGDAGHDVVGVTMRLWGGDSDTGCCSVGDTDDARRAAQQLGIDHLVFSFSDEFAAGVVDPYVDAHANLSTPNPCIECNRTIKFTRLAERADDLGFDAVATGHHARIGTAPGGGRRLERAVDRAKDQSYVLHMLDQERLARTCFPIGEMRKDDVRSLAASLGLRTAAKPDSQDVCFITSTKDRAAFLAERIVSHPGRVVDTAGRSLGEVPSIETVTIGQRRGLGLAGGSAKRYVVDVDAESCVVTVGHEDELAHRELTVAAVSWIEGVPAVPSPADHRGHGADLDRVLVQCSAHGPPRRASVTVEADGTLSVRFARPQRRVAPGQSVVLYDPTDRYVLCGGIAR